MHFKNRVGYLPLVRILCQDVESNRNSPVIPEESNIPKQANK